MAYIDLSEDDVTSAAFAMQRAGVYEIVAPELHASGFTLLELLTDSRTPPRLVAMRKRIWRKVRGVCNDYGKPLYSLPELGRLFNRDHTTIMAAVRNAKLPV